MRKERALLLRRLVVKTRRAALVRRLLGSLFMKAGRMLLGFMEAYETRSCTGFFVYVNLFQTLRSAIAQLFPQLSRDRLVEKYQFDLAEHLKNSPETHFHAVHMFLRYFYILTSKNPGGNGSPHGELRTSHDCLAGWDIALGCLALSVKVSVAFISVSADAFLNAYSS